MRSMSRVALGSMVAVAALALWACTMAGPGDFGETDQAIIYGTDDRQEAYQAEGTEPGATLFDSEVVLVRSSQVVAAGDGYNIMFGQTFNQYITAQYGMPLCADEPYRDQPVTGFCSGFIVGEDLIATAGHCVTSNRDCRTTTFLFGFHMEDATTPVAHFPADDVYRCASIVERVENTTNDWALIRVDRPIVGHSPLPVRHECEPCRPCLGMPREVALIGHPVGLPAKYAAGGYVLDDYRCGYFVASLDAYGGNSGSAVVSLDPVDGHPLVEGILVRGNPDFAADASGTCMRSAVCPDTGCTASGSLIAEQVTRAATFASRTGFCGDHFCGGGTETCASCPDDCGPCPPPACGDGHCNGSETNATCPADCRLPPGAPCTNYYECASGICSRKGVCR